MQNQENSELIQAKVTYQIFKPVAEVFKAIVDPSEMTRYFISDASGPMEEGATITWTFQDADVSFDIQVVEVKENELVKFTWSAGEKDTTVTLKLKAITLNQTEITATETGWNLNSKGVEIALGQTQGWTDMLLCLKAYLEFGINLRKGNKSDK